MSALTSILDAIVTIETAAARTIGGSALTVVKRKLPKKEDPVDASYQVTVAGAEDPDSVTRIAFGGRFRVVYTIDVALVTPNDRSMSVNQDAVTDWRESVRATYQAPTPLVIVPAVRRVEIDRGPLFSRDLLAEGYDYTVVRLLVTTYETRA